MMAEITYQMVLSTIQTIGLLVGIYYYLMVLRNQEKNQQISLKNQELALESQELTRKTQEQALDTRQAQIFMQMYERFRGKTEDYDIILTLQNAKVDSVDDFLHLWENDDVFQKAVMAMTNFCEGLGVLVKENLLDIRYVALTWAGPTRMFWDMFEPILPSLAEHWNYPRLWSETAYLCRELIKYMEEHPELAT